VDIHTPSSSSIISLPMLARVVHLQLLMALIAHCLCTLYLQTSQLSPWDVTPASITAKEAFYYHIYNKTMTAIIKSSWFTVYWMLLYQLQAI